MSKTCFEGPKGGKRKDPLTASECVLLLPNPEAVSAKRRGNAFKNEKVLKRGHKRINQKRKEVNVPPRTFE